MTKGERGVEIVKNITKDILSQLKKDTWIVKLKKHTRTELVKRKFRPILLKFQNIKDKKQKASRENQNLHQNSHQ